MQIGKVMRGDGTAWSEACERAAGFWDRLCGLLRRNGLDPGAAMLIERCGAVHTVGMRFALDLVFVDKAWRVTRTFQNVKPGRVMVSGGWRAARVYEAEAGCLKVGKIKKGDVLKWQG